MGKKFFSETEAENRQKHMANWASIFEQPARRASDHGGRKLRKAWELPGGKRAQIVGGRGHDSRILFRRHNTHAF